MSTINNADEWMHIRRGVGCCNTVVQSHSLNPLPKAAFQLARPATTRVLYCLLLPLLRHSTPQRPGRHALQWSISLLRSRRVQRENNTSVMTRLLS